MSTDGWTQRALRFFASVGWSSPPVPAAMVVDWAAEAMLNACWTGRSAPVQRRVP